MAPKDLPSRALASECFIPDFHTGTLTWRARPREHFPTERAWKRWNTLFAGKPAGSHHGRGRIRIFDRYHMPYRILWLLAYGEPIPDELDHINGDKTDHRLSNLRAATRSQNVCNTRLSTRNQFGAKGIELRDGRYRVRIVHNGRAQRFGSYDTLEQAQAARREIAERLHGKFARHE